MDAVCKMNMEKGSTTPQKIKELVENAFESDGRYRRRLKNMISAVLLNMLI